jgi:hypothetical protein
MDFEERLTFAVIEQFPYENVYFLSPGSYVRILNPDEVFIGRNYKDFSIQEIAFESPLIIDINYFSVSAASNWLQLNDLRNDNSFDWSGLFATTRTESAVSFSYESSIKAVTCHCSNIEVAGESNYAMAA